ncbi:MAG: hypothetical protein H3C64_04960 [Candidatus Kuenenia stuttgartiensis]|uniref:UDP-N-acetylglucosamine--N-acetylmuramyl-(Pentapeptide) pyrophosphoryl-undecaprenol N-acetylglucosamine transferase n=1 Tax=Kuenenia stuttgartiensis TaxID=174633 RepID=A0A2C9CFK2_KUEST|nr:hypothetical protein [Candidatus Kuenenia stuttgartiensis]MCZ7611798.1 hypothetical protein [Ignavibacterium sp.]MBW7941748.1 hypothetical protein [Candidatus Kuenenia stuttgartiensis]MBZ0192653.1 hypothetical protein [Candidatus Kuenenia stuttgartiensis]SOH04466.1 UDP-N-acetylglucosamine--N-acetylmuramyl-(pentapeptide) pyrophosphoryl-undecaprenol N-acetylglucosamine transferase [Candidatus Kuenenia stuttgartiensis]GJQ50497.1 MAG: hypothetical protein HKUEN01_28830 [Candidatus Kuenenia stut
MVEKKNKLIVFRLDAGHERGMGHLYRMMTLADEFRRKGHDCLFVLKRNDVASRILDSVKFRCLSYPVHLTEEDIVEKYFKDELEPDLWIFDILSTDETLVVRTKSMGVPVVSFDDLKGGLLHADLVVNAIAGCWDEESKVSGRIPHVLSGPRYAIITSDIINLKYKKKMPQEDIRIGVTMGGSDTHGATVKIGQVLSRFDEKDMYVNFFLGPHFMHDIEMDEMLAAFSHPFTVKKGVSDLYVELINNNLVICGGGQTMFELCSMGMPVMALANEVHEEKTIRYFERNGACIDIGSVHKELDDEKMCKFIDEIKYDLDKLNRLAVNAVQLVDGKGTKRCYSACAVLIN